MDTAAAKKRCEHLKAYYRDLLTGAPPERRCQECNELLPPTPTIAAITAERNAALGALEEAQGKLEALMKAGVTDYSKFTGTNRVDCHFCNGVWRAEEPAKHKSTCPLDRLQGGRMSIGERERLAQARIAGLEAENARLRDAFDIEVQVHKDTEAGARMLRQELDAASRREKTALTLAERRGEALRKYSVHPGGCYAARFKKGEVSSYDCTCGLDAAIAATPDGEAKE